MPIYEFSCPECDSRFESLVPVGTSSVACPACGSGATVRLMSTPGAPMRLVKTAGENRRQEARNVGLNKDAKARFKKEVGKIHEAKRRQDRGRGPA